MQLLVMLGSVPQGLRFFAFTLIESAASPEGCEVVTQAKVTQRFDQVLDGGQVENDEENDAQSHACQTAPHHLFNTMVTKLNATPRHGQQYCREQCN